MLPLDDEEAGRLLASVPEEGRTRCWWLVRRDGTPVAGDGGGGVLVLAEMRLTRPLGRVLEGVRLSFAIDAVDSFVAGYRKSLGRFVPDGPAPRRYP